MPYYDHVYAFLEWKARLALPFRAHGLIWNEWFYGS